MPLVAENQINIGIENLFPTNTIQRIEEQYPQYIDIQEQSRNRIRGKTDTSPATKSVNKDEKSHMYNWICENGTIDDFSNFDSVFRIIEEIINA